MNVREKFGPVETLEQVKEIVAGFQQRTPGNLLLFRGQNRLHEHVRAGRSRIDNGFPIEVENGWASLAVQMLGMEPGTRKDIGFVKAVLQHYGMATHYVDLSEDIEVAAWFATQRFAAAQRFYMFRSYDEAVYHRKTDTGFLLVFSFPNAEELIGAARLFDLSELPDRFVRPHRQKGWLILDRPPTEPVPDAYWVATIEINCAAFVSQKSLRELFPFPTDDPAYATLLSLPYAQEPLAYKPPPPSEGKPDKVEFDLDEVCVGRRTLRVPEYVEAEGGECINHKWNDLTMYEPHPMRLWKRWRFLLSDLYPSAKGDISDAVKITVSPAAKELLFSEDGEPCAWPELSTNGILFTFAGMDHDKGGAGGPVFEGVWLQRDDDLLFEVPVESDQKQMTVAPGHAYFLIGEKIERQRVATACGCGKPETHDRRIRSVLRLSSLVKRNKLILLPHPTMSSLGWYIAITGSDAAPHKPEIEKWHRIMRHIHTRVASQTPIVPSDER